MEAKRGDAVSSVWLDVKNDIEVKVITGYYQAGERIPPIRKIAEVYGIGINTAQKVLDVLCKENTIYKKRGIGYFVKPFVKEDLCNKHQMKLEKMIRDTIDYAKLINVDPTDIVVRYTEKLKGTGQQ